MRLTGADRVRHDDDLWVGRSSTWRSRWSGSRYQLGHWVVRSIAWYVTCEALAALARYGDQLTVAW